MPTRHARSFVVATVCAALLAPLTAIAQPAAAAAPTPRDQTFTFGDQLVRSSLPVPEGATARGHASHVGPSLIRLREHFVPEMLRSVERL